MQFCYLPTYLFWNLKINLLLLIPSKRWLSILHSRMFFFNLIFHVVIFVHHIQSESIVVHQQMSVDIDRENQINHLILINSFCRLLYSSHDIVFFADCIITFSFFILVYKVLFQFPVMIPSTFIVQGGQITCLFHDFD